MIDSTEESQTSMIAMIDSTEESQTSMIAMIDSTVNINDCYD